MPFCVLLPAACRCAVCSLQQLRRRLFLLFPQFFSPALSPLPLSVSVRRYATPLACGTKLPTAVLFVLEPCDPERSRSSVRFRRTHLVHQTVIGCRTESSVHNPPQSHALHLQQSHLTGNFWSFEFAKHGFSLCRSYGPQEKEIRTARGFGACYTLVYMRIQRRSVHHSRPETTLHWQRLRETWKQTEPPEPIKNTVCPRPAYSRRRTEKQQHDRRRHEKCSNDTSTRKPVRAAQPKREHTHQQYNDAVENLSHAPLGNPSLSRRSTVRPKYQLLRKTVN